MKVLSGDCLAVLPTLAADSFDSCVTDPPYHLVSIVKRFGKPGSAPVKIRLTESQAGSPFERGARGFMGKEWDGGDIASRVETWAEVYRVLKPGAHLVAFGGTRTYHRMACAIEDAGFEIRDCIQWIYGSGFPKSHDVSKGIDRAAGAEREVVGKRDWSNAKMVAGQGISGLKQAGSYAGDYESERVDVPITAPATDDARQWQGWGTALKPACEPIVLARKPLSEGTVAANVLRWGTGAINVDGCRIEIIDRAEYENNAAGRLERLKQSGQNVYSGKVTHNGEPSSGRWPANVVHDGSDEVVQGFPDSEARPGSTKIRGESQNCYGEATRTDGPSHADTGSAARFYYTAKADSDTRIGSKHPTVKPLDLMQWLVRLVTPKGGSVLDPFAGTGTTGEAAWREGCHATLIEREAEYLADIARRMELMKAGPDERVREIVKASGKAQGHEDLPLWGGL